MTAVRDNGYRGWISVEHDKANKQGGDYSESTAISRWYGYAYSGGIRFTLNSENPADEGFDTSTIASIGLLTTPDEAPAMQFLAPGEDEAYGYSIQVANEAYLDNAALSFQAHADGYADDAAVLEALKTEQEIIAREKSIGIDVSERVASPALLRTTQLGASTAAARQSTEKRRHSRRDRAMQPPAGPATGPSGARPPARRPATNAGASRGPRPAGVRPPGRPYGPAPGSAGSAAASAPTSPRAACPR